MATASVGGPAAAALAKVAAAVDRCNRCGFCQAGCPTYKVSGVEWLTARGRIALLRAALEGKLALDGDDLREPLSTCLGCDGCTMHCPPAIRTDEVVDAAREALALADGQPLVRRLILRDLLPRPGLLAAAARAAGLAQQLGLLPLAAGLGQRVLGGQIGAAWDVLPPLPARRARAALAASPEPPARPRARVAYFLGCAGDLIFPDVAAATVRVLRRQQVEVLVPENVCCGKPAAGYGDRAAAQALARRNVDLLAALDVDALVVDCPTCGSFLQKYPELLADDPARAGRAARLAAKVRDVGSFLLELGPAEPRRELGLTVTYHDPCHLAHFQAITAQPRQLLRSLPGVELREAAEADLCCGGAGTYALRERELSLRVLDRKMGHFARTGAAALVTACPSCMLQLGYGARRHGLPVEVLHTVQVLERAYA